MRTGRTGDSRRDFRKWGHHMAAESLPLLRAKHAAYDLETGLEEKSEIVQIDTHCRVEVIEQTATSVVHRAILVLRHSTEEEQRGNTMYTAPRRRRNRGFYRSHYGFNDGGFGFAVRFGSFDRMVRVHQELRASRQRHNHYFWG